MATKPIDNTTPFAPLTRAQLTNALASYVAKSEAARVRDTAELSAYRAGAWPELATRAAKHALTAYLTGASSARALAHTADWVKARISERDSKALDQIARDSGV